MKFKNTLFFIGKDTLSIYGQSSSRLLKELDSLHKQGRFTQLPRAFLGRYIEVPERKYRLAVETILRNVLTAFIVNCDQDRLLLNEVLKKYPDVRRAQIITTEFVDRVYDIRKGKVQLNSQGVVLFDVIKVNDPVVMNCLIDQCKIERIVLVENMDLAIELTQDEATVPRNLYRVVLLKPLSDYFPAPHYRSYSIREEPLKYIQTNFEDLIKDLQKQKKILERKFSETRNNYAQVAGKISEFEKRVADKKKLMADLQRKERDFMKQIEELQSIEFPENTDIEFLRQHLQDEKKLKEQIEKKIEDSREKLIQRRRIVEEFKQAMDQRFDISRQSRDNMRKVQLEVESLQRNLNNMKNDIESKGRLIKNLQDEERDIERKSRDLEARIADMTKKIKGKRVSSRRSEHELQKMIRMNERRIEGIESCNENIEDVEMQLKSKSENLENTRNVHRALDNILKEV